VYVRMRSPLVFATIALLSTACIQIKMSGTSGRQYKKASLSSPLIELSDWFYPGGKPQTTEGIVKSLPAQQVAQIRKDLNLKLEGLRKAHAALLKYLQAEMESPMPEAMPIDLDVERAGEVTEEIRSDNTIYVDLEVLQAFFKTAVVDLSKSPALGHRDAMAASDENKIVQNFLEFKQDLRKTKGRTIIGDVLHDDDDWFTLVDLSQEMARVTSRYYGVLLFTLSHEAGHYALGHLKEKCDPNNCHRFTEMELAADRYATAMMSALVPELPAFFDFDFNGSRQELRGYEPFFRVGYKLAHFTGIGNCACSYPPPEERMQLAEAEQKHATKRLYEEGWIKVNSQRAKPQR
jgi:hypothetical protein